MKIKQLAEEFPFTVVPRTPGLHLTPIIEDILLTLGLGKKYDPDVDPRLQYEKGYLWEVVLSRAFGEKAAHRVGEVELDGILCSPDGVKVEEDGAITVEEYKCTAKSSNSPVEDNISWMMQVKGYCKVLESTSCIFRILYLCGNYRDIRAPQYMAYRLDFTQTEIDENWLAIVNHAKSKGWL